MIKAVVLMGLQIPGYKVRIPNPDQPGGRLLQEKVLSNQELQVEQKLRKEGREVFMTKMVENGDMTLMVINQILNLIGIINLQARMLLGRTYTKI